MTIGPSAPGITAPPVAATERWRRIPLGWRIVLVVLALVVAGELISSTFSGVTSSRNGASGPSSSYDSTSAGTEALAQLLSERGHQVSRLTTSLDAAALPANSTLFVLDPATWKTSDTDALAAALTRGVRVVMGGPPPAKGVLGALLGVAHPPRWRAIPAGTTHAVADEPELSGVETVLSTGPGSYTAGGPGPVTVTPLLQGPGGVAAYVSGGRDLILLASSSPLHNGSLGQADNAAFALDLVAPGSPVVIDEYDHGFGQPGAGLAGLPASWRWGLGLLLLAIVVWVLSAARRFGPPDAPDRLTVPPRVGYVDAMATLLSTRPTDQLIEAAGPVYAEARLRLCRRLGLPPDSSDEVLADRLTHGWDATTLPEGLADAILRPPRSTEDIVAVGTALSQLDREGRNL